MSNLIEHAKTELEMAGYFDKDSDYDGMLGDAVMNLIRVFSDEGHSGMSASITSSLFNKLSLYKPLGPLTGEDNEWTEVRDGVFQNKRCSHVFKENGQAYDSQGILFKDPKGYTFISYSSRVNIDFPYTPTQKIKKVK